MRFWQRIAFYGLCIPPASLSLSFLAIKTIGWKAKENLEMYVNENISSLMHEQEEELGIKYATTPQFRYAIPEREKDQVGEYGPEGNTIFLYPLCIQLEQPSIIEDTKRILCGEDMASARKVIFHELGHAYTDTISEQLTGNNWPRVIPGKTTMAEELCMRMTSEGIAKYFERRMTHQNEKITLDIIHDPEALAMALIKYRPVFYYEGGYQLVKPIIDTYGEKGIAYLITNPPTRISTLAEYQQQALQDLSQEK